MILSILDGFLSDGQANIESRFLLTAGFELVHRRPDRAEVESRALGVLDAVGPVTAKCVDRSGSSKNFPTVRHAARD